MDELDVPNGIVYNHCFKWLNCLFVVVVGLIAAASLVESLGQVAPDLWELRLLLLFVGALLAVLDL